MLGYCLRRTARCLLTAFFVTLLSFSLLRLAPGDPALVLLAQRGVEPDAVSLAAARQELGLDRPFAARYAAWLGGVATGDWGRSYHMPRTVLEEVRRALPLTLGLAGSAAALAFCAALVLGVLAAHRGNGLADRCARVLSVAGTSIPPYWLALALVYCFAVRLGVLPSLGTEGFKGAILPVLSLAFTPFAVHTRILASSLRADADEEYVRFARSTGLTDWQILLRHRLRKGLIPMLTSFGAAVGSLLGGSVVIESIFAWPGMGSLAVDAIFNRDYPLIQGYVLAMAAIYTLVNFLTDLACAALDPRIRLEKTA